MDLILGVGYWGEHTNVIAQTFCELSVRGETIKKYGRMIIRPYNTA